MSAWLPCVVIDNVCATWLASTLIQHSYSTTYDYHMLQHSRLMESFPSPLLVTNVTVAQFHQLHTQLRIHCSVLSDHRWHLFEEFLCLVACFAFILKKSCIFFDECSKERNEYLLSQIEHNQNHFQFLKVFVLSNYLRELNLLPPRAPFFHAKWQLAAK